MRTGGMMGQGEDRRSRHLKRTLNLVSFLANHPGVPVRTVREVFALDKKDFMKVINEILMFGLPPYGPMDYVTAWVEDDKVTVVNAQFLRKPLGLTVAEAVSLKVLIDEFLSQSPGVFQEEAATLSAKIGSILGAAGKPGSVRGVVDEKMKAIEQALDDNVALEIEYYNRSRDALETRVVEPLALADIEGVWYMVAHCRLRAAERSFRVDRIKRAQALEGFERPRQFDISKYQREEMFFPSGHEVAVRVKFGSESARWARERFGKAISDQGSDGSVVCEFPVADMAWVSDLVVEFAGDAQIEGPAEAREAFKGRLREIVEMYDED